MATNGAEEESKTKEMASNDDGDSSDDDSIIAFAAVDFSGVNFDESPNENTDNNPIEEVLDVVDKAALSYERRYLVPCPDSISLDENLVNESLERTRSLCHQLSKGRYADALRSDTAKALFSTNNGDGKLVSAASVTDQIRNRTIAYCTSIGACVEAELVAVASLNIFLQLNYTGPSLDEGTDRDSGREETNDTILAGINPHQMFVDQLYAKDSESVSLSQSGKRMDSSTSEEEKKEPTPTVTKYNTKFQNGVLSELAVDGDWPCQVCQVPYFLLLARSILLTLADPTRPSWLESKTNSIAFVSRDPSSGSIVSEAFTKASANLVSAHLWSGRATLAHQRLLQGEEASVTLWDEARSMFEHCVESFCDPVDTTMPVEEWHMSEELYNERQRSATIMLEWGLAQHHFDRDNKGKAAFRTAMEISGLKVEVTGAEGKRTKYQHSATAQMLVRAISAPHPVSLTDGVMKESNNSDKINATGSDAPFAAEDIKKRMIEHDEEEGILLERVKYEDEMDNKVETLTILDQAILLALCLDVKNDNPMDGLTGEQMGAYLERVMFQHDDWMVYSTALLERAWLECEKVHARERAILQIQALADQHSNRLTLTQSTFESVENSAPAQDRLRNLHTIVYPPRWSIMRDLGEKYAKLGIVTTAAELFEELELWDEVVECYQHAGKESLAESIVRNRLAVSETPRMWKALGDLTNEPDHFKKSLELSKGRYSPAYVALGSYYFAKGELEVSSDYYKKAVKVRPLDPTVWFRLGIISMRLGHWDTALRAFTEVVHQEPEEGDAWGNVAAIHIHNKNSSEAYPALLESLKQNRNNWRVWVSKLYVCLDLKKYDEAIQACHQLMEFKSKKNASEAIPDMEEKCIRAIVGGSLRAFQTATSAKDETAIQSSRRTLARVDELLKKITSTLKSESWVWETSAYFNEQIGRDQKSILSDLMKEHRALQSVSGWETEASKISKVCQVVSQIAEIHRREDTRESLVKSKYLINGVIKKIRAIYFDEATLPTEVQELEGLLVEVENAIATK